MQFSTPPRRLPRIGAFLFAIAHVAAAQVALGHVPTARVAPGPFAVGPIASGPIASGQAEPAVSSALQDVPSEPSVQGESPRSLGAPSPENQAPGPVEPTQAGEPTSIPKQNPKQAATQDPAAWEARERALLLRIQELEQALAQEQALRLQREQEWLQFTQLLQLVPEEKRPPLPGFLGGAEAPEAEPAEAELARKPTAERRQAEARRQRAQAIRSTLRAYLRAEGQHSLDLLEVGDLHEDGVGPIVARQLDAQGRFVSTLVADRLRLEKSDSGYTLTLVFERGYERRAGKTWPFPSGPGAKPSTPLDDSQREALEREGSLRMGAWRLPLPGVDPAPWIKAMPELFSQEDREARVDDGRHNLIHLRYVLNGLLDDYGQGARWKLVRLGGIVGRGMAPPTPSGARCSGPGRTAALCGPRPAAAGGAQCDL